MPNIQPISELRNYTALLETVTPGSPVYLTKNGTGRYVLIDIADYATVEAAERLSHRLMQGRLSGETEGWIGKSEMRQHFAERIHA